MSGDITMEDGKMKTPNGMSRTLVSMLVVAAMAFTLAACSGGGTTGSTSPGVAGPATVSVSIASATGFPAGTTFATSTATLSPATAAPPDNSPDFDNVLVTVTKLALIPSNGPEYPDAGGELEMENSSAGEDKLVTGTLDPPIRINLRDLSGDNVATLLNQFSRVPAGEYSKIRVYYENVVGQKKDQPDKEFHPTAHYHFDVHFVGGNLVIPVTSAPGGGIRFYEVVIKLVGLKYHQAGKSGNILLRPQVFAKMVSAPEYIVTGVADNVDKGNQTFDILALGGRTIPAAFSDPVTKWFYSDNVLRDPPSPWVIGRAASVAIPAFNDRAEVSVIGVFDAGGRLQASDITFSFPDVREGTSDNVWIPPDNTSFIVRSTDNVTVFPKPDRGSAYYDNLVFPHDQLDNTYLGNNLSVRVRGYFEDPEAPDLVLRSYWISIGP